MGCSRVVAGMETLFAISQGTGPNRVRTISTARDGPGASVVGGFDDLYRAEYAPMVQLARGLVDSFEQAEEIVQDAFAKVFERWDRLSEPGGYLRVTVVNGARNELRKRELGRRLGLARRPETVGGEPDHLFDALASLPARQRMVHVLRYYADMTESEIAETLNVRPGTVKSAASRGLSKLRKAIAQ